MRAHPDPHPPETVAIGSLRSASETLLLRQSLQNAGLESFFRQICGACQIN